MPQVSDPSRKVRQANVLRLFKDGMSYREIAAALEIDKDTVTADMKAMTTQADAWATDQRKRARAGALATYQRIIDEAWDGYNDECERERKWLDGDYDREHDAPDLDGGMHKEKKPPPFKVIKVSWLNTIRDAESALTKLHGVDAAQKIEVTGKDGVDLFGRMSDADVLHALSADATARAVAGNGAESSP